MDPDASASETNRPGARQTLALIGLRGAGKSTLGRRLADRTNRSFIDLDDVVAAKLNVPSAGEAIRTKGLPVFREAERHALEIVLRELRGSVIAMGGGTPTAPDAKPLIRAAQANASLSVAYLRLTPMTLVSRTAAQTQVDRPPLTDAGDPFEELGELFQERDPLYSALANTTIECDGLDEELALGVLLDWAGSNPDH